MLFRFDSLMGWPQKKYKHILPLGKNCEVSFQFLHYYGFLESHLFNWGGFFKPEIFPGVVADPDLIFSGEIEEHAQYNIWRCQVTAYAFHGKRRPEELLDAQGQKCPVKTQAERDDMLGRTAHLREKLRRVWRSGESQLYILTVHGPATPDTRSLIEGVSAALHSHCSIAHLCCVVERTHLSGYADLASEKIFIRPVDFFTPADDITNPKKGDLRSWRKIWREFGPEKILTEKKKYKFS